MIITRDWNIKKQERSFKQHKDIIDEIYKMYWEKIKYFEPGIVDGILIENLHECEVYSYTVKDIVKKFDLLNETEVRFLLRQHKNNQIEKCRYCDNGYYTKFRSSRSTNCNHIGYCKKEKCKEPVIIRESYCYMHIEEKNKEHLLWLDEQKKCREEYQAERQKLYVDDLLPDEDFILAIKISEPFIIYKIALSNIKIIWTGKYESEHCFFGLYDENEKFFTWMSEIDLRMAINKSLRANEYQDF